MSATCGRCRLVVLLRVGGGTGAASSAGEEPRSLQVTVHSRADCKPYSAKSIDFRICHTLKAFKILPPSTF